MTPEITVLMSVYNGEKYLKEAIESILNQTFKDFEFLIIDDGSTDSSRNIILSYNDPRIRLVDNEENIGLTRSLNKGLKLARGKYIARMDADDISIPIRFEKQIDFFERNPEYALVGSLYCQIDSDGKKTYVVKHLLSDFDIKVALIRQNWFGHGTVMVRSDILKQIGGYDERFKYSQDYDLFLRISEKYKMINLEDVLYERRICETSITQTNEDEQKRYADMAIVEALNRRGCVDFNDFGSILVMAKNNIINIKNATELCINIIASENKNLRLKSSSIVCGSNELTTHKKTLLTKLSERVSKILISKKINNIIKEYKIEKVNFESSKLSLDNLLIRE